jgi:aldehyde:ferredoxin oxidoreductase
VIASINAATGWNMTIEEALQIGERATNMARVFNMREGFSRKDDTLPERIFQGLQNGPLQGMPIPRDEFAQALTVLYGLKGWDPETGRPSRERLEALSIGWAANLMEMQ